MSLQALRAVFETRINTLMPALDTEYENGVYKPVSGRPYQQTFLMLGNPSNPELRGTFFVENGYFQINLRYPLGAGVGDVEARAQAIRDLFPFGLSINGTGFKVTVKSTPARAPGTNDGDRYQVPVKIFFTANNT